MPRIGPLVKRVAVAADTTLVTTAETVVATLPGVTTQSADERVLLHGFVQMLSGTLATAATLRVRRGTAITDTLIGEANAEAIAASAAGSFDLDVQDAPGEVAGQSYVLTVQQTGASGNGTVQQALLEATIGGE